MGRRPRHGKRGRTVGYALSLRDATRNAAILHCDIVLQQEASITGSEIEVESCLEPICKNKPENRQQYQRADETADYHQTRRTVPTEASEDKVRVFLEAFQSSIRRTSAALAEPLACCGETGRARSIAKNRFLVFVASSASTANEANRMPSCACMQCGRHG
jgi:hypothetical protein